MQPDRYQDGCGDDRAQRRNTAVNVASFLGIAEHYDLILVGGRLVDLDIISQISILYDNDEIAGVSAAKASRWTRRQSCPGTWPRSVT